MSWPTLPTLAGLVAVAVADIDPSPSCPAPLIRDPRGHPPGRKAVMLEPRMFEAVVPEVTLADALMTEAVVLEAAMVPLRESVDWDDQGKAQSH